jgi:hypothetical protein
VERLDIAPSGGMPRSAHTALEFSRDVSIEDAQQHIVAFSEAWSRSEKPVTCFLYGMGAQRSGLYRHVANQSGATVLRLRSLIPWPMAPLRLIVASYEAVLEIPTPAVLSAAFWRVVERSMAGIFFVHPEHAQRIRSELRSAKSLPLDLWSKADCTYALCIIDADNAESPTGLYEIVSVGSAAPAGFQSSMRNIEA